MKTCDGMKARIASQRGVSLIAMSFLLVGLGLFSLPAIQIYKAQGNYAAKAETDQKIADVQTALAHYLTQNGRYPCPAALDATVDSDSFGVEVSSDCSVVLVPGTERAAGRGGRMVRTGTVPTRTLGIPDSYMVDGYKQRLIYAVTEEYAIQGTRAERDHGAIQIIDGSGNNATSSPGNVVQVVYSTGVDLNGSYDMNGVQIQACNAAARSGENCDFATDAVVMNTLQKSSSQNVNNAFVHTISYVPNKDIVPCEDAPAGAMPKDTAFLIDTSGSMTEKVGTCPASLGKGCNRMDMAHWAMRRVIPARMYNNSTIDAPGTTAMTGFRCTTDNNCKKMTQKTFSDITFDDPTVSGYTPPDEATLTTKLEAELKELCPSGGTPLGEHIKQLAARLGSGTAERPNKLTVVSDGLSNVGGDPVTIVKQVVKDYPNLQIDIVDVGGNPGLKTLSDMTGGKYYSSDNPDELLKSLYSSAGVCTPHTPTEPVDKKYCK